MHAAIFHCCDLDINPMILKVEGDLDILKMYLHTENEVAMHKAFKTHNRRWHVHGKNDNKTKKLKVKGQCQM